MTRLAIVASHPVQYYTPLFRQLARNLDLTVFYAHQATVQDQARSGFGVGFNWDIDLFSGYHHEFLTNVANQPGLERFSGVDTPEIGKRLRDGRFDALLLMGWHLKCFLQALFAAKRIGLPAMVRGDSHLETPRSALKLAAKRVLYPPFLRQFDAALIVGKRNRAYWEHYGYPHERMFHSPHCVDNEWFATRANLAAREELRGRNGIPHDAKVVMFAGKLIPLKRVADLLYAVSQAQTRTERTIHLMIAGSGPLEADLKATASSLGITCYWLGFCNQGVMSAVHAASDLCVLPSEHETWGLVVNEALACCRPVLVSDAVGCAPDIAEHMGSGAVYKMGNVAALAHRIGALLRLPPCRASMLRASSHFTIPKAADGVLDAVTMLTRRHH